MSELPGGVARPAPLRSIARVARGVATRDGAGVKLTRLVGTPELRGVDPVLMLDEFRSDDPNDYLAGFPAHPHRGFETFTYMIAGRFRHEDDRGHVGAIEAGGGQWMTAGRGIVHSEMPEQKEGLVWGFQLWLNLPAAEKMRAPDYRDLAPREILTAALGPGARARVVAGRVGGVVGPMGADRATRPLFAEVALDAGAEAIVPIPEGHQGLVVAFEGAVGAGDGREQALARGEVGVLGTEAGAVRLVASGGPARALVIAGKPLREPVAQLGPFVMNTEQELRQAVADFRSGRF